MSTFEYGAEAEPTTVAPDTLRTQLERDFSTLPEVETCSEVVADRPEYVVTYNELIDHDVQTQASKYATLPDPKTGLDTVNEVMYATYILAAQCKEIKRDGVSIVFDNGPFLLKSQDLIDMTKTASQSEAIRKFFGGNDYELLRHCRVVTQKVRALLTGEVNPTN